MYAFLLSLSLVCISQYHCVVQALPADIHADIVALLQPIESTSLNFSNENPTASVNSSTVNDTGYHWDIPHSHMTLHITVLPEALPLPSQETLKCLRNFIDQLTLFPKDRSLDRLRYVVFNNLQVSMAPLHQELPLTDITFAAAKRSIAALWFFISRSNLLTELRFAVFETGKMVAWGLLDYREGKRPSSPMAVLVPTAVE